MVVRFKFTSFDGQIIEGMRTEFDRNYDDEETAIIFIEDEHHTDTEGYFELNVRKEQGKLTQEGYVCEYTSTDDTDAAHMTDLTMLQVTEHDFDDALTQANEDLLKVGKQIVLEYDDECYWGIGVQDKHTGEIDWYATADFEHEVRQDIFECWAHTRARVNNPELVQPTEGKMYVVTYVGLSDSEYDANGYSECKICKTKEDAKQKLKEWRDNEIECLKAEDREYEILEDEDDECRISWCGHGEQLRLEIHECEL